MIPSSINPNRITDTPPKGSCWVCDEPRIPVEGQLRIPALCSEECRGAWVRMMAVQPSRGGEEDNYAKEEGGAA